ncbi:MAG: hypothetical protein FWE84_00765 [Firmicutes bacterium]|nr:hypothetical protein [Bacillota bacterium]
MKKVHITPGYMILKGKELEKELNASGKTAISFADTMDIRVIIAYTMLSGKKAGLEISRRFIYRYGADFAHNFIDWATMGMADPYDKIGKRHIITRHYERRNFT